MLMYLTVEGSYYRVQMKRSTSCCHLADVNTHFVQSKIYVSRTSVRMYVKRIFLKIGYSVFLL